MASTLYNPLTFGLRWQFGACAFASLPAWFCFVDGPELLAFRLGLRYG